jgi:hypothetical protein
MAIAVRFRQQHEMNTTLGPRQAWKNSSIFVVYNLADPLENGFKRIASQLRALRDKNLAQADRLMAQEKEFSPAGSRYYREHVRSASEKRKGGLLSFAQLC